MKADKGTTGERGKTGTREIQIEREREINQKIVGDECRRTTMAESEKKMLYTETRNAVKPQGILACQNTLSG